MELLSGLTCNVERIRATKVKCAITFLPFGPHSGGLPLANFYKLRQNYIDEKSISIVGNKQASGFEWCDCLISHHFISLVYLQQVLPPLTVRALLNHKCKDTATARDPSRENSRIKFSKIFGLKSNNPNPNILEKYAIYPKISSPRHLLTQKFSTI